MYERTEETEHKRQLGFLKTIRKRHIRTMEARLAVYDQKIRALEAGE